MRPLVSVVVPSRDRPGAVGRAVESALAQGEAVEVIVVDDGSVAPLRAWTDPRVRLIRRERSGGAAVARNAGLAEARGAWVTFLDDDDRLAPGMVERSLASIAGSALPPPVAAVSGVDVVAGSGRPIDRRVPPSHPLGEHFSLEPLPRGRSHMTKQTLLADTGLLLSLGGFDAVLAFREWTDLLLRLNPVCSIEGVTDTGYLLTRDRAPHMSRDPERVRRGYLDLTAKHRELLAAHPEGHADLLLGQARLALVSGPCRSLPGYVARALRVAPAATMRALLDPRRAIAAALRPARTG